MAARLTINRGTTYSITYQHFINGVSASLVGATVYFTVKSAENDTSSLDATAIIKKDVTSHTDPTHGITTITLDPSATSYVNGTSNYINPGRYYYDIKVKDATGNIYLTEKGRVNIAGSSTNRGIS